MAYKNATNYKYCHSIQYNEKIQIIQYDLHRKNQKLLMKTTLLLTMDFRYEYRV